MKLRARKGISSLVTGAILLTATVLMGTGLVSWSNTNLSSYQTSLSNSYSSNVNKLNEDLVIENVWFQNSPKSLNITLTNIGKEGLNVTDIKLINSTKTLDKQYSNQSILPKYQNTVSINPYIWTKGIPVQIIVTTSRGSVFTNQVMPP